MAMFKDSSEVLKFIKDTEVVFLDMQPGDGRYEPLIGYIPLEQSQALVDMTGHRLVHTLRVDLK